ncbi:unnamed protein product, partial [Penicillium discolor]
MRLQATEDPRPDVIITEVGGTVGDIESQPFLESARQLRHELGRDSVFFVHVSLGLDSYIVRRLGLDQKAADVDWTRWNKVLHAVHNPKHEVTIGLVGKYIDLPDAYLSVTEALKAGGFAQETK